MYNILNYPDSYLLTLQRLNFFEVMYTNSVRASQETHYFPTTDTIQLMLFREKIIRLL
jgi:hypothetical protein